MSWNTCMMFEKKNSVSLNSSENKNLIVNGDKSLIFSDASQVHKTQYEFSKGHVANREDDVFINDNVNNISYICQGSCNDTVNDSNTSRREDMQSDMSYRLGEGTCKAPVVRQDSIALDIGLDDSAKTSHEMPNQAIINDKYEHTKELHSREAENQCEVKRFRHLREEKISHPDHNYHIGVHQQQWKQKPPCNQMPAQSIQNNNSQPHSGFHKTNPRESLQSLSLEPYCQQSSRSTNSLISSEQVNSGRQSVKKIMKVCSFDKSDNIKKNAGKEIMNKLKDVNSFDKLKIKTWSLTSIIRQETIIVNVLIAAVIALVVVVIHLHMRVQAIEDSGSYLPKDRCQCHKDGQMFNKNQVMEVGNIKSTSEDTYKKIMQYFGKESKEAPAESNGTSQAPMSVFYNEDKQDSFPRKDERGNTRNQHDHSSVIDLLGNFETNESSTILRSVTSNYLTTSSEISASNVLTNWNNNSYTSFKEKIAELRLWDSNTSRTPDIKMFEFQDLNQDTTGQTLSRKIRSGQKKIGKTKDHDQDFFQKIRPTGNSSGGNVKAPGKSSGGNVKSQAESFEARFFEIFDYSTYFMNKDCFTYDKWEKDIEVCRDATVFFPHQHSVLPFYNVSKETAGRKHKHRMIHTKANKPGQFHVQQSGDYLVQLNITVVDETEKHFLALYLNGQAMIACQHGGFRCPHLNHHHTNKYRICNIFGLLELRKDDVVDIRTMERNMKVRIQDESKSYFRFILLSKTK